MRSAIAVIILSLLCVVSLFFIWAAFAITIPILFSGRITDTLTSGNRMAWMNTPSVSRTEKQQKTQTSDFHDMGDVRCDLLDMHPDCSGHLRIVMDLGVMADIKV